VWYAVGTELATIEGMTVSVTRGLAIASDATLVGSSSGDVWLFHSGTIARYSIPIDPDETYWETNLLPVYSRVCSNGHAPNNQVSHVDLSTYDSWRVRRSDIHHRVIELAGSNDASRMPPMNAPSLTATEQGAIAMWSSGSVSDAGVPDGW
jgi:hypothetical protein